MISDTSLQLFDIWGESATDLYAVGGNGTVLHYDGSIWTPMVTGTDINLRSVWSVADSDIFAVGLDHAILHYSEQ